MICNLPDSLRFSSRAGRDGVSIFLAFILHYKLYKGVFNGGH
jgi:hypothetical protein